MQEKDRKNKEENDALRKEIQNQKSAFEDDEVESPKHDP